MIHEESISSNAHLCDNQFSHCLRRGRKGRDRMETFPGSILATNVSKKEWKSTDMAILGTCHLTWQTRRRGACQLSLDSVYFSKNLRIILQYLRRSTGVPVRQENYELESNSATGDEEEYILLPVISYLTSRFFRVEIPDNDLGCCH